VTSIDVMSTEFSADVLERVHCREEDEMIHVNFALESKMIGGATSSRVTDMLDMAALRKF
jgi:hypothetical protein